MHIDFMTPKGHKITPSNEKKEESNRTAIKGREWRGKKKT